MPRTTAQPIAWDRAEKNRFCYYHCSLASPLGYTADRLSRDFRRPISDAELHDMTSQMRAADELPARGCKFRYNFPLSKIHAVFDVCFYDGAPKLTGAEDTETFAAAALAANETVADPYGNQLTAESVRWIYWCLEYEGASHFRVPEKIELEMAYEFDMIKAEKRLLTLDDHAMFMRRRFMFHHFEPRHIAFQLKHAIEMGTFDHRRWDSAKSAVAWFNSVDNGEFNLFWHGKSLLYETREST